MVQQNKAVIEGSKDLATRRKIPNTERARLDTIVKFEDIKDLIIALGVRIGDSNKL